LLVIWWKLFEIKLAFLYFLSWTEKDNLMTS